MLLLLAACQTEPSSPDVTGPDTTPDETEPTSWTVPDATDPPTFDAAALGAGLDAVLAALIQIDSIPAFSAYDAAMSHAGGACPDVYGYSYGSGWYDAWYSQCESPDGATFSGYASDYTEDGYRGLYMSATVLTPEGYTLSGAGYFAYGFSQYGADRYSYAYLDGILEYDGPEAAGTWVEGHLQPHELQIDRGDAGNDRWHTVYVDGQFTGAAGAVDTVDFSEVYVDSTYECAEPSGAISIRTADGDWFDLDFASSVGPCDGCGVASWRGLELGEVCGDFTLWTEQ